MTDLSAFELIYLPLWTRTIMLTSSSDRNLLARLRTVRVADKVDRSINTICCLNLYEFNHIVLFVESCDCIWLNSQVEDRQPF